MSETMRLFKRITGALGEIRTPDPRNRNPMLYPAELRAPVRSLIRTGKTLPAATCCSEAGVPAAVLADIGGGALVAFHGRRAVIIGEGTWDLAGTIIVQIADRI